MSILPIPPEWRPVLGSFIRDEVNAPILDCQNCRRLMTIKSVRPCLIRRASVVDYFCANCGTVEVLTVARHSEPDQPKSEAKAARKSDPTSGAGRGHP